MKHLLLLILSLALLACGANPNQAPTVPTEVVMPVSEVIKTVAEAKPIGECLRPTAAFLKVAPAGWQTALEEASAGWEPAGLKRVELREDCLWKLDVKDLEPGTVAKAQGKWIGPQRRYGYMVVDEGWLKLLSTSEQTCQAKVFQYLLQNVAGHEFGHYYGLRFGGKDDAHSTESVSLMVPTVYRGCALHPPSEADLATARAALEHRRKSLGVEFTIDVVFKVPPELEKQLGI